MRVLIIEDEQQSVEITSGALRSIDGEIEIVGSLPSIKASVDWLRNNQEPDLILCDVRLEDGESFEILRRVRLCAPDRWHYGLRHPIGMTKTPSLR